LGFEDSKGINKEIAAKIHKAISKLSYIVDL